MALFGPPPTPTLREEWSGLSKEVRKEAIELLFGPPGMSEADARTRLVEMGLSAELAEWASKCAVEKIRSLGRMALDEPVARPGRLDRFNVLLVSLIVSLFSLTWFAQEVQSLRDGMTPVGIIPATLVTLVSTLIFLACLRRWIQSLKRR